MKEEFLHFVWKHRLYDPGSLFDSSGNHIVVISPGEYNRDSGPDFFNSRIISGGTEWAGNTEVHISSSDWFRHGHNSDNSYNNVIVHFVLNNDRQAVTASGNPVPSVIPVIKPGVYEKYLRYTLNPLLIACQEEIGRIDSYILSHWLTSLAVERLQAKAEAIGTTLRETGNDWEETLYRLAARYYGARVNTDNFEMLARSLPLKLLRKHADNRLQVEALLFGMAGMLSGELFRDAVRDEYFRDMMREFRVLQSKYSLVPMHGWLWKFNRLRPAGFPTIRLSQLAGLVCRRSGLFSGIVEAGSLDGIITLLDNPASPYWRDHYTFGKQAGSRSGHAGRDALEIIIINVIVPMLFVYGSGRGNNRFGDMAVDLLEACAPESNRVTREWRGIGVSATSAADTQALNHLLNEYCRRRKCLECRIGQRLISQGVGPGDNHQTLLENGTPVQDF